MWMQFLYMHVLLLRPREPGPPETADFHVSWSLAAVLLLHAMGLARWLGHLTKLALGACDEPGSAPSRQPIAPLMKDRSPARYPLLNHLLVPDEYLHRQ